jgi:hypothetical protein
MRDRYNTDSIEKVKQYYLSNLSTLSLKKQFHFLSRNYLWTGGNIEKILLEEMRPVWWIRYADACSRLTHAIEAVPTTLCESKKQYRKEVARKYYTLRYYNRLFFMCLFDETIYGNVQRDLLRQQLDMSHLCRTRDMLMHDPESLFRLSTVGVNFLSLSNYFFGDELCPFTVSSCSKVSDAVILQDPSHDLDARTYFYTHALIGMTRFYATEIPPHALPDCIVLLKRLEQLLKDNYEKLSLDHKCEFLVCAALCDYMTPLREKIYDELQQSVSPQGMYFVNTMNVHSVKNVNASLSRMEHTNVLAIMAYTDKKWL